MFLHYVFAPIFILETPNIIPMAEYVKRLKQKERMLSGKPSDNLSKGRVRKNIAKVVGKGEITLEKIVAVAETVKKHPEKLWDK
jgi:hypothetical protein